MEEIQSYLGDVKVHLHLDERCEQQVLIELYSHFCEKRDELIASGYDAGAAIALAIRSLGRPRVVARLMYEAHSRGSWLDSLMSAVPHLLVAALFINHLWRNAVPSAFLFSFIVAVTLFGWWYGKPNWLYAWVGYAVLPLITGCIHAAVYLYPSIARDALARVHPPPIIVVAIIALYILTLWIIFSTVRRVSSRDWVLASSILVPLPLVGAWMIRLHQLHPVSIVEMSLAQWDWSLAINLLVLGIASAVSTRTRKRRFKAGHILLVSTIAGMLFAHLIWNELSTLGTIVIGLFLLAFYLIPVAFTVRRAHTIEANEAWWDSLSSRDTSAIT